METRLFEKQADIAKAIAHPVRVAALEFLKNGEQCVCDIAEAVGTERSNLSKHLSIMVNVGVLVERSFKATRRRTAKNAGGVISFTPCHAGLDPG